MGILANKISAQWNVCEPRGLTPANTPIRLCFAAAIGDEVEQYVTALVTAGFNQVNAQIQPFPNQIQSLQTQLGTLQAVQTQMQTMQTQIATLQTDVATLQTAITVQLVPAINQILTQLAQQAATPPAVP